MRRFKKLQPPNLSPTWQQRQIDWTAELDANPSISPKSARASYFDTIPKPDYRPALSQEQDQLCAYCEGLLTVDASGSPDNSNEIAHWLPIAASGGLASMLEWKNLVLSCSSRESCNHAQGDQTMGIDAPHLRDWSKQMSFQSSGLASTTDPALDRAMKVARLDGHESADLRRARKAAIDGELEQIHRRFNTQTVSRSILERRIGELGVTPASFVSARLEHLEKRLAKARRP